MRARRSSARRMALISSTCNGDGILAAEGCRQAVLDITTPGESEPAFWLHREVSHLPEKYRIVILLCYFEGLTHEGRSQADWAGCPATVQGAGTGPCPRTAATRPSFDSPWRHPVRDAALIPT